MKKTFIFFLGLIFSLLLFEGILRIIGYRYSNNLISSDLSDNIPIIACVGDSFTYSSGVPRGADYPRVLQRMIGKSYKVLNLGIPGSNTTDSIDTINKLLKQHVPKAIILQTGPANNWNFKGYQDFLRHTTHKSSFYQNLKQFLINLRTIKFLRLVKRKINDHSIMPSSKENKPKSIAKKSLSSNSTDAKNTSVIETVKNEYEYVPSLKEILDKLPKYKHEKSFTPINIPTKYFSFLKDIDLRSKHFENTLDSDFLTDPFSKAITNGNIYKAKKIVFSMKNGPEKMLKSAIIELSSDNLDKADAIILKCKSLYPEYTKIYALDGYILMEKEKYKKSLYNYASALKSNTVEITVIYSIIKLLRNSDYLKKAAELGKRIILNYHDYPPLYQIVSEIFYLLNNEKMAYDISKESLKYFPDSLENLTFMLRVSLKNKDFNISKKLISNILKKNKALCFIEAENFINRKLKPPKKIVPPKKDEISNAKETKTVITALDNNKINELLYQAIEKERKGELLDANDIYIKLIRLNYFNQEIFIKIVKFYYNKHDFIKARKWAMDGIKKCTKKGKLFFYIGESYRHEKKLKTAFEYYEKAIDENRYLLSKIVTVSLYDLIENKHDFFVGYEWAKPYIKKYPDADINFFFHLSGVYFLGLRDYKHAIEFLSKSNSKGDREIATKLNNDNFYKQVPFNIKLNDWMRKDYSKIINICKENKIKLIFLNYPEYKNTVMEGLSKDHNIPLVDNYMHFQSLFKDNKDNHDNYILPDDMHFTAAGNKIEAGLVYKKLKEIGII